MSQVPISVYIITLNEADHIEQVIEAASQFDEIVLVDSGSTDGTVEKAKALGAKVHHQSWLGYAAQKQHACKLCSNDWVLNLDGDEVLPAEVANSIQEKVNSGNVDALRLFFEDVFWGKPMASQSAKRSIIRCFHRDKARYPLDRLVHENLVLEKGARVENVPGLVTHYGYGTTHIWMEKQNAYSSLKAKEKFQQGKKPGLLKLLLVFPIFFIRNYFFRKMFLSGKRGLVHALIDTMYAFLKEAKLYEHHQLSRQQKDKDS